MSPFHRMARRCTAIALAAAGALALAGCSDIHRREPLQPAPEAEVFRHADGAEAVQYRFTVGRAEAAQAALFFYGGSGCRSWGAVMPGYVRALGTDAHVFVLNKRHVPDDAIGDPPCGAAFRRDNHPAQWRADAEGFVRASLATLPVRPREVVLVGVSEGGITAAALARRMPEVTRLVLIGEGGMTLRQSLRTLAARGRMGTFDLEAGFAEVAAEPRSLEAMWLGHPHRWWTDVLDLDPLPDLLALDKPILVGFGEADESVPVESGRMLAEAFAKAGKRNLTLRVYPGADHRLQAGSRNVRDDLFAELGSLLRDGATADAANPSRTGVR